jgi:hypothetical protein
MILSRVLGKDVNKNFNIQALVLIDNLCAFSLFPLLKASLKMRPVIILYFQASGLGLKLASLLKVCGLVSVEPLHAKDLFLCDLPHSEGSQIRFEAFEVCAKKQPEINKLIDRMLPKVNSYTREACAVGARKELQNHFEKLLFQQNLGRILAQEAGCSTEKVVLISNFAFLINKLDFTSKYSGGIKVYQQAIGNKEWLYLWGSVFFSFTQVIMTMAKILFPEKKYPSNKNDNKERIGVAGVWGFEGTDKNRVDDLFWWRKSGIAAERLLYMFERFDILPIWERLSRLKELGISAVVLNSKFKGDASEHLIIRPRLSFKESFRNFLFHSKLALRGVLGDKYFQSVGALTSLQFHKSTKLKNIYHNTKLRGLFHFDEAGLESVTLATRRSNVARIGTHWSCVIAPNHSTMRNHEVFFVWGSHDLKIALDSGSTAKNILISGCPMTESSYQEEFLRGQKAVKSMKMKGVRYTLALFDNSVPVPNFYRFFLQWLMEDPALGILIKSKGKSWKAVHEDGLEILVQKALDSGRLFVMDSGASPVDAALLSNFSIGVTGISAIALAALKGARVLYLDYEYLDKGPLKDYTLLHSLGEKRCVFYNPESLKDSVLEYINSPEANPNLGDASSTLDQIDPFRDGNASQRIGEYVSWVLEALDKNFSRESAIRSATKKYSEKWGRDKVIRGL